MTTVAPAIPTADPVVPLRRAAEECGRHPDTLKRYAARGHLRLLRVGPRKLGIRRSELERFLAAGEERPTQSFDARDAERDSGG